jgi:PAS domain S-box-containing protein
MTPWRDAFFALAALPETGPLLLSENAAWIWSREGDRLLWANPAGGARIGIKRFAELSAWHWPRGHALRRAIESLSRTAPKAGSLARLRLLDDPRAVSVACRCRYLRAAGERGVLVEELEAASRPEPTDLATFLADEGFGVAILDESGIVLAETSPGIAAAVDPTAAFIPVAQCGRPLRLYPLQQAEGNDTPATPGGSDAQVAPELPFGVSVEKTEATSRRRTPSPPVAIAEPATENEGREQTGRRSPSTAPAKEAPPSSRHAAARQRGRKQKRESGEPTDTLPAAPSITAGRVPRELSRKSVRFLWQTDSADRLLFVSPGLAQVVGRNAEVVGESWQDISSRLRLDPTGRIARALKQRDTWSGLTAWWPIEGSNVRVPVELTALPVFGLDHSFQGYRGFGVLRSAEALMPAAYEARFGSAAVAPPEHGAPYEETTSGAPANVVPIRADIERMAEQARLTSNEKSAFEEIAAALRSRIVPAADEPAEENSASSAEDGEQQSEDGATAQHVAGAGPVVPLFRREARERQAVAGASEEPAVHERAAGDQAPSTEAAAPPSKPHTTERPKAEPPPAPDRTGNALHARLADAERRVREMAAILDTATDGVVILDDKGVIERVNASAEAIFGLDAQELVGRPFDELLTPPSRQAALDYLSGLRDSGVASLLNEGREVEARAGSGSIPLFITMGSISGEEGARFCAVLRDITHWKRTERDLLNARRTAEDASRQKSEFLARVSHEIRTPLNAIIGFAEVMAEERFGPMENQRYREYLRDIRSSGEHVVSLVNDLLDISKIEAGKVDLDFTAVPLNEVVRESVALMQPQANRAHVVLRMSLSRDVPSIVADQRTLRQIVLNLLSNSVKFTGPGGQVIVSTSLAETGEALLRVRDTGEGMSDAELARALEPFRQLSTASITDRSGTGLGLPLTKALVEANRASLSIRSARGEGTVVTVTFPPTRVLSE